MQNRDMIIVECGVVLHHLCWTCKYLVLHIRNAGKTINIDNPDEH